MKMVLVAVPYRLTQRPAVVRQVARVIISRSPQARPKATQSSLAKQSAQPVRRIQSQQIPIFRKQIQPIVISRRTPHVVAGASKAVRPSPLIHIANERNQILASFQGAVQAIKDAGKGRILIIIGNGPSILEASLEKLKDRQEIDIMSVNRPDHRVWPTKYWIFTDQNMVMRNKELWDGYTGTLINASSVRDKKSRQVMVRSMPGVGFSKNLLSGFHIGRSTVYAAMQVAYWMEYDRVYIFGIDMCAVGDKLHFYGQNPDVDNKNRMARFAHEAESYLFAAKNLSDAEKKKYVFCSSYNPHEFMKYFDRMDQKTAADEILKWLEASKIKT